MTPPSLMRLFAAALAAVVSAGAIAATPTAASSASAPGNPRSPSMAEPRASGGASRASRESLAPLFTASIGPWKLEELGSPEHNPMPGPKVLLIAVYAEGRHQARISVAANPPSGDLAPGQMAVYREPVTDRQEHLVAFTLANGVSFSAVSPTADLASLEALLRGLDLDRAGRLQPAAP